LQSIRDVVTSYGSVDREAKGEPDDEGIAVFDEKSKKYPRLRHALSEYADRILEIGRAIRIAGAESPHGYPLSLGEIEWRIERDNRWRGIKGTPGEDSPRVKAARGRVRAAEERAFAGNLKPQEHRDAVEALRNAEEKLEEAISFASTASLSTGGPDGEMMEQEDDTDVVSPDHLIERLFLDHYTSPKNPAGLNPRELEVFRLAIHLEHREIAEEIGRTEGLVRQLKHRAVKKVRKHGEITVRDHIDTNARKRGRTKKSA
jgi:DNA-directed RNA polymerase specialized sigma24 family protein